MMLHKINSKLCRLCGKEKQQGTDVFKDEVKGAVLISIINKYFSKEVINISTTDAFSKFVCMDCEQKICIFDEFCLMVANVQKQLAAPSLEIDFAEVWNEYKKSGFIFLNNIHNKVLYHIYLDHQDMLCHLKENNGPEKNCGNKPEIRKYICLICSKSFRCQAHLDRHKRIHTGQRPFVCNICKMSFNQQEILVKHMERHEGKRLFQCANCHQSFRYKVSLKSHMINFHMDTEQALINNQMLPLDNNCFPCSECGKQFVTKYKLQRHSRCHTGERPYPCSFCSKTFSQTGNLKVHQAKCHQVQNTLPEIREQPQLSAQVMDRDLTVSSNSFHSVYISESEIQKTINETINSTDPSTSFLTKMYDNPLYMDDEIETMLDQDLGQLEQSKYTSPAQDKVPLCLKQPETPELLHSLLYDD